VIYPACLETAMANKSPFIVLFQMKDALLGKGLVHGLSSIFWV